MGVVWFEPDLGAVILEERAYDVLVSDSDSLDALAFVLGHELAHYYKGHDWTADFVRNTADLAVGRTLKGLAASSRRSIEVETESDYFSGFYGRMAGYQPLEAAGGALARIYAEYDLGDQLAGYASLAERQTMAERTAGQLRELIPVFDGGNWLLLTGRYTEAAACFDYVGRSFPSREILNNTGVAKTLAAIGLFEKGRLPFAYPLELDAQTRLRDTGKAADYEWEATDDERRDRLLADARQSFELARRRDPGYAAAVINLACVADLQGDHEEALLLARRGLSIARKNDEPLAQAHALVIQGIAHTRGEMPDTALARQAFEQALADDDWFARQALAVLDGTSHATEDGDDATLPASRPESIDGLTAREYDLTLSAPDVQVKVPPIFTEEADLVFYSSKTGAGSSLVIDSGYSTFSFRRAERAAVAPTARGIAIGARQEDVVAVYGAATHTIAGITSTHLVYQTAQIVFSVDAALVTGWMIYDVE